MSASTVIGRREFIISSLAVGGGMAIGISLPVLSEGVVAPRAGTASPGGRETELSAWITIAPDDIVTVRVATPEVGNGVMTQGALTVAEELQCDWSKVRAEFAPPNRNYREQGVYSSNVGPLAYFSGRSTGAERTQLLLQVGASARERLKAAAARRWEASVANIEARNSVLTHTPSGRTLRYGEVAGEAATINLPREPKLKPQERWTLLGKRTPTKLNNQAIVTGSAVFGIDVRLPGMLYAALLQSPVHGGKLKHYDFEAIRSMPGVRGIAVVDPSEPRKALQELPPFAENDAQSAIAVVADHYWQARKALEALPVEWDPGSGAQWKTTEQAYAAALAAVDGKERKIEKRSGDAERALAAATKVVDATYLTPLCEHAAMEPLNGTALVTPERVDVWHPSQHSHQAFLTAAHECGIDPVKVFFHQTFVGGGFGRRIYGNDVRMVVAVAKKFPGRPVHVIWSREETTRQGRYRPLAVARLRAALHPDSKMPTALDVRVSDAGFGFRGLIDGPYVNGEVITNVQIESMRLPLHILTGPYRGPGYNSYAFMLESFIDECAHAAGIDALEYRLQMVERWPDPSWKGCLQELAKQAQWDKPLPRGQGRGIAISNWGMEGKPSAGTTIAAIASVEVSRGGELRILQLDLAFDTGKVMNRDAVLAQLQGGAVFGLNMALNEELHIQDGAIVEGNFDQYRMLRIGDMPRAINVHFGALSGADRFSEVGEAPVGVVGPAVANAIFNATGKRIRSMPFVKHDLSWGA
ncbi:MAG: molybdopterin cofactor-binding domain-containing protein [Steroidobacteraceae bacterium]